MATTRRKKSMDPADTIAAWYSSPNRRTDLGYSDLASLGWEPGQVGHLTVDGVNYERFFFDDGRFIVIQWDDDGNICV